MLSPGTPKISIYSTCLGYHKYIFIVERIDYYVKTLYAKALNT